MNTVACRLLITSEKFGVAKLVTVYIVLMLLISLLNLFAWVLLYFSLDAGVWYVDLYTCRFLVNTLTANIVLWG